MDPSKLADRLRAIVGGATVRSKPDGTSVPGVSAIVSDIERVLGGHWRHRDGHSGFVVERRLARDVRYGDERVSAMEDRLAAASAEASLVMGTTGDGNAARCPFVFFDLETTGLSGGAGTFAFLIGCGSFDGRGGFLTRQFVLLHPAEERQLLQMVGADLAQAGALVSFNGKSFDAPLIEMRYLFHRLEWPGSRLPHLDVLHPARRFWSDRHPDSRCSLTALEGQVLGTRRAGDVAGSEIPARYFQFVRSGDARLLAAVLEHNRLDLLSLAGLTARLLHLVRAGPGAARDAREVLALGHVYARSGLPDRAGEAYEQAFATGTAPVRIDAARALARLFRRARRYDDAAAFWRELLGIPTCPPHLAREASEALAVHHEHRARDLAAAKAFALQSLGESPGSEDARATARNLAVRHRLARIERKMNRPRGSSLEFQLET
jgi:uncharacterized protein YprB with RNaseH-like and TPR domain